MTLISEGYTNLGSGGRQEVVDLLVDILCTCQILYTANLGLAEMVAVNGGGDGGSVHSNRHELQKPSVRKS